MTEQLLLPVVGPDARIRELLEGLAGDPRYARDREEVVAAIVKVADANHGIVSNNEVRRLLPAWVKPQVVGSVISALTKKGALEVAGLNISDDRNSGNSGRWQPYRRLVDRPAVAA